MINKQNQHLHQIKIPWLNSNVGDVYTLIKIGEKAAYRFLKDQKNLHRSLNSYLYSLRHTKFCQIVDTLPNLH